MSVPSPDLRIFFSIDIINSTAFKSTHQKSLQSSNWFMFFKKFYDDIPLRLQKKYDGQGKILNFSFPYVWRFVGDEIIFYASIKKYEHINIHVAIFKNLIEELNNDKDKDFEIKGCAWLAGFPVHNATLGELNDICNRTIDIYKTNGVIDFIGPSIDLGFRISKYADKRKFILSVDLAMIISYNVLHAKSYWKKRFPKFNFYFDKELPTKGINDGQYPIIWIDVDRKKDYYDRLYGIKEQTKEDIFSYCKDTVYNENYKLFPPFIEKINHEVFSKPENYADSYKEVIEKLYKNQRENDTYQRDDIPNNNNDDDDETTARINRISDEIFGEIIQKSK